MEIRMMWRVLLVTIGMVACNSAIATMPDFYLEPGLNPSRAYSQSTDFDLVDPFTGKLQLHHTDISIPGDGGMKLDVTRSYTSGDGWVMGDAWTTGFGYVYRKSTAALCATGLFVSNMYNPVLVLQDGSRHVLTDSDDAAYLFITNHYWKATCADSMNGGLIVTSPDGTIYEMTYSAGDLNFQKWYASKITDRNGNWISITYQNPNGNGALVSSVTTSDGRTLTYSYIVDAYGYGRLSSISDGNRTWRYGYIDGTSVGLSVGTYLLNTVTLPDNTTWIYTYNGNLGISAGSYKINSVTTPQGGKVTYVYGFADFNLSSGYTQDEVVVSRTVAGSGTWNYSYTPSTGLGVLDTTTVTAPNSLQTVVYKHYGYNTVASVGEVWKIGLLAQKSTGSVQTESYSWTPQAVSSQNDARPYTWTTKVDNSFNHALLVSKVISRNGATYSTTYGSFDSYGNPGTVTEAGPNGGNRTTTLTYNVDPTNWVLHQVQNESYSGSMVSRLFDANHNLTSISVNGVTTAHTYVKGNVTSTTYPRALTHNYSNFYRGIPRAETQPEGISITRVVGNAGTITSEKNGRGFTTSYVYDGLNRPTSITLPANNPVSISYTATTKTATRGSLVESTLYDGFGRPVSITIGGIKTTYQYDPLGRVIFKSNPGSTLGTNFTYDELDRSKIITHADGSTRSYTYNAANVAITDERGKITTYTYRAYGDPNQAYLMNISAPVATANVVITRNTLGQIATAAQNGLTRSYAYNANSYLSQVTDPETGVTIYGRDEAGNMTTRKVGASGTTTYTYDQQNRLTHVSYPGTTPATTQTYTLTNKLSKVTSGTTTRTLGYNANDSLITEVLAIDGYNLSATHGYDANDQLSSITYPQSGKVVSYTPDVLGRPTVVTGYASSVTYWPSGQVRQINYQNGTVSKYGQNSRLWPSTLSTQNPAAAYYINSSYGYDQGGNLTTITDTSTPELNRVFGYDAINRLTTINASSSWGTGVISYDGKGNISSQTYGTSGVAYTYSANNQLTSVSGALRNANYTYDNYGDILSDGSGKVYTFNDVPNLTGLSDSNAGTSVSYVYDGLNKRTKVIKNGIATYEFFDFAGKLLMEYTPGTPDNLIEYIYLGNMRIAQRMYSQ